MDNGRNHSYAKTLIIYAWPPGNQKLAELISPSWKNGRLLSGNDGIVDLSLYGEDNKIETASIRRYPRLGRAVFHLDSIPRLPEVDNLFEAPISLTEISYKGSFLRAVADPVLGQSAFPNSRFDLDESFFPITFTNTTPIKILEEFERLTGKRIYFDKENFRLTDKRPATAFERARTKVVETWKKWFP